MSRKQLEIQLSQMIRSFDSPKIIFEQYQTPPRVAANLLHIAWTRGDIDDKSVIDICAGTGILGLGAALLGADVTLLEIDPDVCSIQRQNIDNIGIHVDSICIDVFKWGSDKKFDTALLNPPFGIQQKKHTDLDFVRRAADVADTIYSIHDGSPKNQEKLPQKFTELGLEVIEAYLDEFPLDKKYPWHTMSRKVHHALIIHSERS